MTNNIKIIILLIILFNCTDGFTEKNTPVNENFYSLSSWEHKKFRKIKKYTNYKTVSENGKTILRIESVKSASILVHKLEFNVYRYPVLKFRWKVSNIYRNGNGKTKSGDDYPIRVYVMFKYDLEKLSVFETLKYKAAKLSMGINPPQSSLCYVWSSKNFVEDFITNPYRKNLKMIFLQKGSKNTGRWMDEKVNILTDYKKTFGANPPEIAYIAVMADADNTGESSVSYVDFIKISAK